MSNINNLYKRYPWQHLTVSTHNGYTHADLNDASAPVTTREPRYMIKTTKIEVKTKEEMKGTEEENLDDVFAYAKFNQLPEFPRNVLAYEVNGLRATFISEIVDEIYEFVNQPQKPPTKLIAFVPFKSSVLFQLLKSGFGIGFLGNDKDHFEETLKIATFLQKMEKMAYEVTDEKNENDRLIPVTENGKNKEKTWMNNYSHRSAKNLLISDKKDIRVASPNYEDTTLWDDPNYKDTTLWDDETVYTYTQDEDGTWQLFDNDEEIANGTSETYLDIAIVQHLRKPTDEDIEKIEKMLKANKKSEESTETTKNENEAHKIIPVDSNAPKYNCYLKNGTDYKSMTRNDLLALTEEIYNMTLTNGCIEHVVPQSELWEPYVNKKMHISQLLLNPRVKEESTQTIICKIPALHWYEVHLQIDENENGASFGATFYIPSSKDSRYHNILFNKTYNVDNIRLNGEKLEKAFPFMKKAHLSQLSTQRASSKLTNRFFPSNQLKYRSLGDDSDSDSSGSGSSSDDGKAIRFTRDSSDSDSDSSSSGGSSDDGKAIRFTRDSSDSSDSSSSSGASRLSDSDSDDAGIPDIAVPDIPGVPDNLRQLNLVAQKIEYNGTYTWSIKEDSLLKLKKNNSSESPIYLRFWTTIKHNNIQILTGTQITLKTTPDWFEVKDKDENKTWYIYSSQLLANEFDLRKEWTLNGEDSVYSQHLQKMVKEVNWHETQEWNMHFQKDKKEKLISIWATHLPLVYDNTSTFIRQGEQMYVYYKIKGDGYAYHDIRSDKRQDHFYLVEATDENRNETLTEDEIGPEYILVPDVNVPENGKDIPFQNCMYSIPIVKLIELKEATELKDISKMNRAFILSSIMINNEEGIHEEWVYPQTTSFSGKDDYFKYYNKDKDKEEYYANAFKEDLQEFDSMVTFKDDTKRRRKKKNTNSSLPLSLATYKIQLKKMESFRRDSIEFNTINDFYTLEETEYKTFTVKRNTDDDADDGKFKTTDVFFTEDSYFCNFSDQHVYIETRVSEESVVYDLMSDIPLCNKFDTPSTPNLMDMYLNDPSYANLLAAELDILLYMGKVWTTPEDGKKITANGNGFYNIQDLYNQEKGDCDTKPKTECEKNNDGCTWIAGSKKIQTKGKCVFYAEELRTIDLKEHMQLLNYASNAGIQLEDQDILCMSVRNSEDDLVSFSLLYNWKNESLRKRRYKASRESKDDNIDVFELVLGWSKEELIWDGSSCNEEPTFESKSSGEKIYPFNLKIDGEKEHTLKSVFESQYNSIHGFDEWDKIYIKIVGEDKPRTSQKCRISPNKHFIRFELRDELAGLKKDGELSWVREYLLFDNRNVESKTLVSDQSMWNKRGFRVPFEENVQTDFVTHLCQRVSNLTGRHCVVRSKYDTNSIPNFVFPPVFNDKNKNKKFIFGKYKVVDEKAIVWESLKKYALTSVGSAKYFQDVFKLKSSFNPLHVKYLNLVCKPRLFHNDVSHDDIPKEQEEDVEIFRNGSIINAYLNLDKLLLPLDKLKNNDRNAAS